MLLLPFSGILFADWQETLHNAQIHTPIWTEGALTVAVLALIGVAGYLYLSFVSVQKVPDVYKRQSFTFLLPSAKPISHTTF